MVMPVVVLAVALYAFFLRLQLNGTFVGFVIAHTIIALPFAIISISNALEGFDKRIEDAAVLCGASPLEAKLRVTLPAIKSGLFGAAIFSFLASWDEVVVAIFHGQPGTFRRSRSASSRPFGRTSRRWWPPCRPFWSR